MICCDIEMSGLAQLQLKIAANSRAGTFLMCEVDRPSQRQLYPPAKTSGMFLCWKPIKCRTGKTPFHLVALGEADKILVKKKFIQWQLLTYTAKMQTSLAGLEACSGAHFLGRASRCAADRSSGYRHGLSLQETPPESQGAGPSSQCSSAACLDTYRCASRSSR